VTLFSRYADWYYDWKKKTEGADSMRLDEHPASARGTDYFLEKGIEHSLYCGYKRVVPLLEPSDIEPGPYTSKEVTVDRACGTIEQYWIPDGPPQELAAGVESRAP
jgi:hypothetical protein